MNTIHARLSRAAAVHPQRTAIASAETSLSFVELLARVDELARVLRPQEIIGVRLPSGPRFTVASLACLRAGAVFLPISPAATDAEVEGVTGLVTPNRWLRAEDDASDRGPAIELDGSGKIRSAAPGSSFDVWLPRATAMVQLTSGSTGVPKPILLSEANMVANLDGCAEFTEAFAGEPVFSPMPQYHAMGGAVVLEHLLAGSPVLTATRFMPGDVKARMDAAQIRLLVCNPSYARMALRMKLLAGVSSLRAVALGSASADAALIRELREARAGLHVHLRYGLSEAYGTLARLDLAPNELPLPGLVGSPVRHVEFAPLPRVGCGDSEVRARAESVAVGVVRAGRVVAPITDPDGWLATGDHGCEDLRGVHLRGRASTFIKRHGHRIDPCEVEEAVVEHHGVADAVVVGVPDPIAGSRVVAAFESVDEVAVDPSEVLALCRERLSTHKVPTRIVAMDPLPRLASGKPDRAAVRARVVERDP